MEKDIGKIKKNDITDIVIRVDDFGGRPGITIREFATGDRYTGFTKSGTKIPIDKFAEFKEMINSISDADIAQVKEEAATSGSSENNENTATSPTPTQTATTSPEQEKLDEIKEETI